LLIIASIADQDKKEKKWSFVGYYLLSLILFLLFYSCVYFSFDEEIKLFSANYFINLFSELFDAIIYIISNPIFWVSVGAPTILLVQKAWLNNSLILRNNSASNDNDTEVKTIDIDIKEIVQIVNKNPIAGAWNDFNNQILVVLLSFVFSVIETLKEFIQFHHETGTSLRNYYNIIISDLYTILLIASFIFILFWFLFFQFFSGKMTKIESFRVYIERVRNQIEIKQSSIGFPPFHTNLTIMRFSIILYAIMLMIWKLWIYTSLKDQILNCVQ